MDQPMVYNILYALAASEGREAALFGSCSPAAYEAFVRSLTGSTFPEIWFEFPLVGEPWLDFHALVSYEDVAGTQASFAGLDGIYTSALEWFAGQKPGKVRQLALSYDTSSGDVEHPAVQLLVNGSDPSVPLGFLEAAGRSEAKNAYRAFVDNMPREWYACYVGAFPGRDAADAASWVRVECIVGDKLQRAYAEDADVLREHLALVGIVDIDDRAIDCIQTLAQSHFPLEFQFNVGLDGAALPVISASVRFDVTDWTDEARRGEIGRLAGWLQTQGLSDERCWLLADMAFNKRVSRDGASVMLSCFPAFVKLRWRAEGAPAGSADASIDAKIYLLARVDTAD